MKEEYGKWEEIIRSKLYDFETETDPEDWVVISDSLPPEGRSVRVHPYRRAAAIAAAAVAVLFIVGGGLRWFYLSGDDDAGVERVTASVREESSDVDAAVEMPVERPGLFDDEQVVRAVKGSAPSPVVELPLADTERSSSAAGGSEWRAPLRRSVRLGPRKATAEVARVRMKDRLELPLTARVRAGEGVLPEATFSAKPLMAAVKRRRWGFGMGGGGYSVSSSAANAVPLTLSSLRVFDDEAMLKEVTHLNDKSGRRADDRSYAREVSAGKIKHKTPLSAGLGVGYALDDRWSLHSGVTYTFLRSEWHSDPQKDDYAEYRQSLHFIGVPLSVSCKMAEWERCRFYVSAGGECELNVAGGYRKTIFSENLRKMHNRDLRMKAPVWSVNARIGVTCPLWRFINVYAEAGASYYFASGSPVRTIRSDKPFNVSLQAGFRFGF
jgi:hypothetical protein